MLIVAIGLLAQVFFTARIFIQWIRSERSHRIESPTLFWVFSVVGSVLLFLYGWLRNDFSIIFGEFLSFYIYLWNLKTKGLYEHLSNRMSILLPFLWLLSLLPIFLIIYIALHLDSFHGQFLKNTEVSMFALIWGSIGQFIYKMRFVYQWYYSYRHHQSSLPVSFWWMAVVGSAMIILYGIYRTDFILVLGQFGIVASFRNIIIGSKSVATDQKHSTHETEAH